MLGGGGNWVFWGATASRKSGGVEMNHSSALKYCFYGGFIANHAARDKGNENQIEK